MMGKTAIEVVVGVGIRIVPLEAGSWAMKGKHPSKGSKGQQLEDMN